MAWLLILTIELNSLSSAQNGDNTVAVETTVNRYTTEITETVETAKISIVSIYATNGDAERVSTGVIYGSVEDDIYIFTLASAIESADSITVRFDSGAEVTGTNAGTDSVSGLGLVKCTPSFQTSAIKLGDSSIVSDGEYVIALGGKRAETESALVSFGIAGSIGGRRLDATSTWISPVIETDAVVNTANTGGALLNIGGELIGILVPRTASSLSDMGYALGINEVKQLYAQLVKNGKVERGALGAVCSSISGMESYQKSERGIRLDLTTGVIVSSIAEDSAAAGVLEENDILKSMDGDTISNSDELMEMLYEHTAGDTVSFNVTRDGEDMTLSVVLK